jgi:Domain of unknown function (DUF1844)
MEREEEKPKAFTVKDRRRFSSEGDLKPEFREGDEETPSAAPPEPPPATSTGEARRTEAEAHADPYAHDAHHAEETGHSQHLGDQPHDHHAHAGATAEITFGTFLVGLSTQALMHLGDIPDPQTGKPEQDLVGAQQLIDIIGMLEQKTRGNLDRDEAQLIEAILYELRMKYVERARPAR